MNDDKRQGDMLLIARGAGGVMIVVTGRGTASVMIGVEELPPKGGLRHYEPTDRRTAAVALETTRHCITYATDHDAALEAVSEWLVRP